MSILSGLSSSWTISSRFTEIAQSNPAQVALSLGSSSLTYGELNARADRLASELRSQGIGPESLVGLFMDRSIAMIIALVAILKAGGAYLPLDPVNPSGRLSAILNDARPTWILTEEGLLDSLPENAAHTICLNADGLPITPISAFQLINDHSAETDSGDAGPDNLCYVIYTSGSTGNPKGVMVTHRNVARLITETEPWFHFGPQDTWTFFHSVAFDFSVWEIWGALLTGGRLVIVPYALSRSPADFLKLLASERVTVLNQTPSAFYQLIQADKYALHPTLALRIVIFGGEALNFRALLPWFQSRGDNQPRCINMYGITETTVHVTYREVGLRDAEQSAESRIGIPIPDLTLHLLGADLRQVAAGETGEIYIGGAGLARGYLNSPELTDARYIQDPFASDQNNPGARLYRSGDLARRLPDGELEYLGRADLQVKIRGYRIELGEIESALLTIPLITEARVIAHTDDQGEKRLVAYYVSPGGQTIENAILRDALRSQLPEYMMPSAFLAVDIMPVTVNGKLDISALPKPRYGSAQPTASASPVSDTLEARIAATWSKTLGAEHISYNDHFFDIGGNSRLIVTVHRELEESLGRRIPITDLFAYTTVQALAAHLGNSSRAAEQRQQRETKAQQQRNAFARLRGERKRIQ